MVAFTKMVNRLPVVSNPIYDNKFMKIGTVGLNTNRAEAGTVRHQRHSYLCVVLIGFHYSRKGVGWGNGRLAILRSQFHNMGKSIPK
jgi:hypothetical protein